MHNFELHPDFYNQPILLTDEEKQDPLSVIQKFFDDVKLIEARIQLYNLLGVALTKGDCIYDDANERDAAICFVRQFEKIIEACHTL